LVTSEDLVSSNHKVVPLEMIGGKKSEGYFYAVVGRVFFF
jgi:hypothetical protein